MLKAERAIDIQKTNHTNIILGDTLPNSKINSTNTSITRIF